MLIAKWTGSEAPTLDVDTTTSSSATAGAAAGDLAAAKNRPIQISDDSSDYALLIVGHSSDSSATEEPEADQPSTVLLSLCSIEQKHGETGGKLVVHEKTEESGGSKQPTAAASLLMISDFFAGIPVRFIHTSYDTSYVCARDGHVYAWGQSQYGQCGVIAHLVSEPRLIELEDTSETECIHGVTRRHSKKAARMIVASKTGVLCVTVDEQDWVNMYDLIEKYETILLLLLELDEEEEARKLSKNRKKRRWGVRPLNQNRNVDSTYNRLIKPMRWFDPEKHVEYFRIDRDRFDELLRLVAPLIRHQKTHSLWIPPEVRLSMALRFLVTGESFQSIAMQYFTHRSTVRKSCYEVFRAMIVVLRPYLPKPTRADWIRDAQEYEDLWQFPNCATAKDGRLCKIKAPAHSGSENFCYKNFHAINLMACCSAKLRFQVVNVGASGRNADGTVFNESTFGKQLHDGRADWPEGRCLPGTDVFMPYVSVADEAFMLTPNSMRPYARNRSGVPLDEDKAIFNYRLSRARRCADNTFALLICRCQCVGGTLRMSKQYAILVVTCACYFHNYMLATDHRVPVAARYYNPALIATAKKLKAPDGMESNNYSRKAAGVRDCFKNYFVNNWPLGNQLKVVQRGRTLPP